MQTLSKGTRVPYILVGFRSMMDDGPDCEAR